MPWHNDCAEVARVRRDPRASVRADSVGPYAFWPLQPSERATYGYLSDGSLRWPAHACGLDHRSGFPGRNWVRWAVGQNRTTDTRISARLARLDPQRAGATAQLALAIENGRARLALAAAHAQLPADERAGLPDVHQAVDVRGELGEQQHRV